MAKVVIIHDNGTQEPVREVANDYYKGNILFRDDYFAIKIWSPEDIEDRMKDLGYTMTPERVSEVINHGGKWRGLSDCYDGEWDCIDDEIYATLGKPDNLDDDWDDEENKDDEDCPYWNEGCPLLSVNCTATKKNHREECPYEWN